MTNSTSQPIDGSPAMEDPDRLARRLIQRAYNRDGLPEIAAGLIFLFMSGFIAASHVLGKQWPALRAIPAAMILLLPLLFMVPGAIKWARNRWLIEREGYVEMKPLSSNRRMQVISIAMIVAVIAAVAGAAVLRAHISHPSHWVSNTRQWVLIGNGVIFGIIFPVCGRSLRFVINGAVVAVTGILLGLYNAGYDTGWVVLFGVAGAITVISGVIVLIRYLRQTPGAGDSYEREDSATGRG